MEKLSSILPASARVKSVDLSEAKPRRPGAPSFGTPVGTTAAKDRVTLTSAEDAAKEAPTYKNKDARGAKIANDIATKFFETRLLKEELGTKPRSEAVAEVLTQDPAIESEPQVPDRYDESEASMPNNANLRAIRQQIRAPIEE